MRAAVLALALLGCHHAAEPDVTPDATPDGPGHDFCLATDPRTVPVAIAPTPEAGEQPYIDALAPAQTSIHVEIYEMGHGAILDQLIAKARAGVDVRVLFDRAQISVNQKYSDQ